MNIGHSFRLPGANELASNGVHHGTFRHEQGDASLNSEKGWQWDAAWSWFHEKITVHVSPFAGYFTNYIYLRPTGDWSILPHAGQIYRYTGASVLFLGAETSIDATLPAGFSYQFSADYVRSQNCDEKIPVSFSPPANVRNTLTWQWKRIEIYAGHQYIARQNRTDRNEDPTPGANLFNAGATLSIPVMGTMPQVTLSARNMLNERYFNHLSFYRKVEIPEPGRSFQILMRIPF
jgi:iron complex outermembrane receptor protein